MGDDLAWLPNYISATAVLENQFLWNHRMVVRELLLLVPLAALATTNVSSSKIDSAN